MSDWRIAVIDFDHTHVYTNLGWIDDHPRTELVALCDENPETSTRSMIDAAERFEVPDEHVYEDLERCIERSDPDVIFLHPATSRHAQFTERAAAFDVHIIVEKPFASTLAEADRMIEAIPPDRILAINWRSTWSPEIRTMKRLVETGAIGDVHEIRYTGGNSGPPLGSWFFDAGRGGGSMLDFLGYGVTNAVWLRDGDLPEAVFADAYVPDDREVDERSVTVAHYDRGLSTFDTTFRKFGGVAEEHQVPPNGYTVIGTDGTITSAGRTDELWLQTHDQPTGRAIETDAVDPPHQNVIQYVLHGLENEEPIEGPTSPSVSRKGQQIIETARRSMEQGRRIPLVD